MAFPVQPWAYSASIVIVAQMKPWMIATYLVIAILLITYVYGF
ncbi:MAG: hypothetical protein ACKO2I_02885 [Actinomycetales bacterium]